MHYRILDAGDGRFEIQRIEPVTIGVMYDAALADLVLAILETDDDAIFRAKAAIRTSVAEPRGVSRTSRTSYPLLRIASETQRGRSASTKNRTGEGRLSDKSDSPTSLAGRDALPG